MLRSFRFGVTAIALIVGAGLALAQQQSNGSSDQQMQGNQATKSDSGKAGAEEPSSHAPSAAAPVFVNGVLAVPGAPADGQTVPAKFSARNAGIDALPTMAFPLPITPEQTRVIHDAVIKANQPVEKITAKTTDELPVSVQLRDLPQEVVAQIPAVRDLKFVQLADKVLVVRAPNRIVVAEIAN